MIYQLITLKERKVAIAKEEINIVNNQLAEFNKTGDLKLLSSALNRFESNRCGNRFSESVASLDLYNTDNLNFAIYSAIDKCDSLEYLSELESVLNSEFQKFVITMENINRKSEFDLEIKKINNYIRKKRKELEKLK